jgi:hypothetical protein
MPALSEWQQLLADLATGVWRLRKRARESDPPPGMCRDLDALAERLAEAGVEVHDHTGEPYDPTKALRVLAFEATPGATAQTISETVKPTIYHNGQWLQLGEVVVRTPAIDPPAGEAP